MIGNSAAWSILSGFDLDKSSGPTNLGHKLFRECAVPLTAALIILFNASINEGSTPVEWKSHFIVPVVKSGNKADVTNYRSIFHYAQSQRYLNP